MHQTTCQLVNATSILLATIAPLLSCLQATGVVCRDMNVEPWQAPMWHTANVSTPFTSSESCCRVRAGTTWCDTSGADSVLMLPLWTKLLPTSDSA